MRIARIACAATSALCVGCTILTSETLEQVTKADRSPRGAYYVLPKGVVDVTLSVVPSSGDFTLQIGTVKYVPDNRHQYYLSYLPHPSYDDHIIVNTDKSGFLTSIDSTTEDRTPAAIVALASAVSAFRGLESETIPAGETLLSLTIDPLDHAEMHAAAEGVTDRIHRYIKTELKSCEYYSAKPNSADTASLTHLKNKRATLSATLIILGKRKTSIDAEVATAGQAVGQAPADCSTTRDPAILKLCKLLKQQSDLADETADTTAEQTSVNAAIKDIEDNRKATAPRCAVYRALNADPPRAQIAILDHLGRPAAVASRGSSSWAVKVSAAGEPVPSDCTVGICYRPKEPFKLVYSLGDGDITAIVDLPNNAPIVEIDVRRTFLVKKIQKMTFTDGFLTKLEVDKKSELVALSKLPVDVASAIATGLQARVKITTKQKDVVTQETELLKAQAAATQPQLESAPVRRASGFESAPDRPRSAVSVGATSRRYSP